MKDCFYIAGSSLIQPEKRLLIKILELRGNCFGQTKCEPAISKPFLFIDLKIGPIFLRVKFLMCPLKLKLRCLRHCQLLAPPGASSMTALMRVGTIYQSPPRDMFCPYLNHFWSAFFKNRFFWFALYGCSAM